MSRRTTPATAGTDTPARPREGDDASPPSAAEGTPLARLLRAPGGRTRATPLDAFTRARAQWLAGERIDIGRLASDLGVSRATVFRWVGSRELLHGEVICALFDEAVAYARRRARGRGAALIADATRHLLGFLVAAEPLRRFVQHDTDFALRVLMSATSRVERHCTAVVREMIENQVRAGALRPAMDLDDLAYVVVRIGEAFLYRDVITGDPPDVGKAVTAIKHLLSAPRGR